MSFIHYVDYFPMCNIYSLVPQLTYVTQTESLYDKIFDLHRYDIHVYSVHSKDQRVRN